MTQRPLTPEEKQRMEEYLSSLDPELAADLRIIWETNRNKPRMDVNKFHEETGFPKFVYDPDRAGIVRCVTISIKRGHQLTIENLYRIRSMFGW